MNINWEFIALLLTIATGLITTSSTFYKVWKLILEKTRVQDKRVQSLYEVLKILSTETEDIVEYLAQEPATRSKFYRRKSLTSLKDEAFRDYEDERTGFS